MPFTWFTLYKNILLDIKEQWSIVKNWSIAAMSIIKVWLS